jgi:Tfp pilus assembly protein PilE
MCARRTRGFTLVEMVVLIAVVAAALLAKQALAVAEAMLDRILLERYEDVDAYHGYSTAGGIRDVENNPIAGLESYDVASVSVTTTTLNDTGGTLPAVAEAKRVTVVVTGPGNVSVPLEGYRVRYAQ